MKINLLSIALLACFFVSMLTLVVPVNPANASSSTTTLQVLSSNYHTGTVLTGYHVVLTQGSTVVSEGFTPASFSVVSGQTYQIKADDYGSCHFFAWLVGGGNDTSNPMTFVASSSNTEITASYQCGSTVSVNSVDQSGKVITGYYTVLYGGTGDMIATNFTAVSFPITSGLSYSVRVDNYGGCTFTRWSDGVTANPRRFIDLTGPMNFTAVYNCGGESSSGAPGTITVSAHRIPASYWAPCFATTCTNAMASCNTSCTGPGASMYFVLYNSAGTLVGTAFANENGYTFTGLSPGATYYVYPADCDLCHGSTHNVVFAHWGDGSTARPIAVTANGANMEAWYSCTNGCVGP